MEETERGLLRLEIKLSEKRGQFVFRILQSSVYAAFQDMIQFSQKNLSPLGYFPESKIIK